MTDNILNKEQFANHLLASLDSAIYAQVAKKVDELLANPNWQSKVQSLVTQDMIQRLMTQLSLVDVNGLIALETRKYLKERHEARLPEAGLVDDAGSVQLSLLDGSVVVENALITKTLEVLDLATISELRVKTLKLPDEVIDSTLEVVSKHIASVFFSEWMESAVIEAEKVIAKATVRSDQLQHRGKPLLTHNSLTSDIRLSALNTVGTLEKLTVKGETALGDALSIERRTTAATALALTVQDNEVAIAIGKLSDNVAYVGTTRSQALTLGVNRKGILKITNDGTVSVPKLKINANTVAFANAMPDYEGTKGDLVFNASPAEGNPFAWQCLGGASWRGVKAE